MGGGGGRGMTAPMTVKQTGDTLTVETEGRNGPQTRTYKLDGSEVDMPMGQMTAKVSAKWDGPKLVITTKTDQGEQTQTWSLAGGVLTIDRTGGRGPSSTRTRRPLSLRSSRLANTSPTAGKLTLPGFFFVTATARASSALIAEERAQELPDRLARYRVAQVGAYFRQRAEDKESRPEPRMRH